jgi:hypothetical protein
MAVPVAVHQPAPDRTLAVWLDSAPDLSSTDSTQAHWVDGEHQPTDLAVCDSNRLAAGRDILSSSNGPRCHAAGSVAGVFLENLHIT